jgi:hypothetical protein
MRQQLGSHGPGSCCLCSLRISNAILSVPALRRFKKGGLHARTYRTRSVESRNRPIWLARNIDQTLISDLQPYPNNVRVHSDKDVARLAESLAEFGFVVPILIDPTART